jgi:hypothetical protein
MRGSGRHVTNRALLGDDLARALARAPDGLSCDALAERLRRRRVDVLATLRSDARFDCMGHTRARRWRLVSDNGTERDGFSAWVGVLDRLGALEARVKALERRDGAL